MKKVADASAAASRRLLTRRDRRRSKQRRITTDARSSVGKRRCFHNAIAKSVSSFCSARARPSHESLNILADHNRATGLYLYGSFSPIVRGGSRRRKQAIDRQILNQLRSSNHINGFITKTVSISSNAIDGNRFTNLN